MRSIRGWIRNLADGLSPAPGSVVVSAKPLVDGAELSLTAHRLGALDRIHESGGSTSPLLADNVGHFGWDMEQSPGPINVRVTPSDPQTEYRFRFPDESAQIGKGFLSDVERLGWAGGRHGIVWNAVPRGTIRPPGGAQVNPYNTGNAAVLEFGSGADAGRWKVSRFIAILGGVPFTVEMSDMMVPVVGDSPAPPNGTSAERWDLYCCCMVDDPSLTTYGKQYFELTPGSPGGGIPAFPVGSSVLRRIPLHALRMPGNSASYDSAVDLRQWLHPPRGTYQGNQMVSVISSGSQAISSSRVGSVLNSSFPQQFLSLQEAYSGFLQYDAQFTLQEAGSLHVFPTYQGVNDVTGNPIGPNFCVDGFVQLHQQPAVNSPTAGVMGEYSASVLMPIRSVGPYSGNPTGELRTWTRFIASLDLQGGQLGVDPGVVVHQRCVLMLWADT